MLSIKISNELEGLSDQYEELVDGLTIHNIHKFNKVQATIANRLIIAIGCARSLEKATAELEVTSSGIT
jgi:hypothetical protein